MPAIQRTLHIYPKDGTTLSLNDTTTTGSFVMSNAAGGMIYRAASGTAGDVTISFYCDPLDTGTQHRLVDSAGSPVTIALGQSECAPLPDGLFSAGRVYMRLNSSQTASVRIAHKS